MTILVFGRNNVFIKSFQFLLTFRETGPAEPEWAGGVGASGLLPPSPPHQDSDQNRNNTFSIKISLTKFYKLSLPPIFRPPASSEIDLPFDHMTLIENK